MYDENQAVAFWLILGFISVIFLPTLVAYLRQICERRREISERKRLPANNEPQRAAAEDRAILGDRLAHERPFLPVTLTEVETHVQARVNISGTGRTSSLSFAFASTVDYPIEIEIPRGSCFKSLNSLKQNMMTIETISLRLSPRASADAVIPAVCINRRLAVPTVGDGFISASDRSPLFGAAGLPKPAYLDSVLDSPRFREGSSRLRQIAIWTITDDLARKELRGMIRAALAKHASEAERLHGLGDSASMAHTDSIDREADRETDILIAEVKELFQSVDVETSGYDAFRSNAQEDMCAA